MVCAVISLFVLCHFCVIPSASGRKMPSGDQNGRPYGPGGSTDIAGRTLATYSTFLGQSVTLLNIPSAGGAVGFDDVRKRT
jgi:tripartite-type tricarboxylate transporter receptor subunit TctC